VPRSSGCCGVVRCADSSSNDAYVLDDREVGNYERCYIWRCGNDTISGVDLPTMVQRHFHRRDTACDHYLRPNPRCDGTRRSARNQPAVLVLIAFCWLFISSDCVASVAILSGTLTIDRQLGADEASGPVSHSHSLWERVGVRVNRRLVISASHFPTPVDGSSVEGAGAATPSECDCTPDPSAVLGESDVDECAGSCSLRFRNNRQHYPRRMVGTGVNRVVGFDHVCVTTNRVACVRVHIESREVRT
jgi:hypothetical protein